MSGQQGPAVEHMELCSVLCGRLDERGVWERMDPCICMPESLCCSPETVTTLNQLYPNTKQKVFFFKCIYFFNSLFTMVCQKNFRFFG